MTDINRGRMFRYGCLFVAVVYVFLAGSILSRGVEASIAPFGVPESIVASPFYVDAITWVYVHMMVLGILIGVVGWFAESIRFQKVFCLVLFGVHLAYLYLDLRTSDTAFGNGLYVGPESAFPAAIVFVFLIVFALMCFALWFNRSSGNES